MQKKSRYPYCLEHLFEQGAKAFSVFILLVLSGIILSLVISSWPSIRAFGWRFLFSGQWDVPKNLFGALIPVYGTVYTSVVALIIAIPISFGIAIFLTELSPEWLKRPLSIAIELLAAIPSIVYGMWGLFFFAPLFSEYIQAPLINFFAPVPVLNGLIAGPAYGVGLLTTGIVLSIMIIPFISATMKDVFEQTPALMKESAHGLGATSWEVVRHIVIPHTKTGIISGIILGLGRALGETMAVTFLIGNSFNPSLSIFSAGNSITSTLTNEFAEASGKLHNAALMELGLVVFLIGLVVILLAKKLIKTG